MRSFLLTAVCVFVALVTSAQYIARLEPYPYTGTLSMCAGGQISVRGNHIENLGSPSTISARISDANGNMSNGTDLPIDEYSFDGTNWQPGPFIWTGNISGPVYYKLTLPATLSAGSGYNLKLQSSNPTYIQADQDFNATLAVTSAYGTIPTVGTADFGTNQWLVHAYGWTATTTAPFITQALVDQQDFFNPSNYTGHFVLDDLSFDLDFTATGGTMPGPLHDGTSIPCFDQSSQNYSLRFQRTENFGPGRYRFEIQGDDGIRLSIDGGATWLVNSFLEQTYSESYQASDAAHPDGVCLSGEVDLVVEFFQRPADHRVTLTVTQLSPEINAPESVSICGTEDVVFDADASDPSIAWQWQVSTNNGGTWTDLSDAPPYSGTTTGVLSISGANESQDGYLYQAVVTGACNQPTTTGAALLSAAEGATILNQELALAVCEGENILVGVAAEGGTTFQWQADFGNGFEDLNEGPDFSNVNSQTMLVLDAEMSLSGTNFQLVIGSACGPDVLSDPIEVTVTGIPELLEEPENASGCEGEATSFEVVVAGTNVNYQWEVSTDAGLSWTPLTDESPYNGTASNVLNIDALANSMNDLRYRCRIASCGADILSSELTVRVTSSAEAPLLPNVFSPNGDGINDVLTIEVAQYEEYRVDVYNRWGQLMGYFTTPEVGWDGRHFDGSEAPIGYYMMVVDIVGNCLQVNEGRSVMLTR